MFYVPGNKSVARFPSEHIGQHFPLDMTCKPIGHVKTGQARLAHVNLLLEQ